MYKTLIKKIKKTSIIGRFTIYKTEIDDLLFGKYRDGDIECFQELYFKTSPWLCKMIFRITGDLEIARDIEQDSWLTIINNQPNWKPNVKISNLIFTIAKNNALKWKRRAEIESKYYDVGNYFSIDDYSTIQIENYERTQILRNAILSLPEIYQEVIILFYLAEMKIYDIADLLEVSENTVKSRIKRAKSKLELILIPNVCNF